MDVSNTVATVQTPRPTSQYGRACLACARGKLRCVPQEDGGSKCERCARLNRDCEQPSARKRRSVKGGVGKVAQLESKLDGLVTLLKAATQPTSLDDGHHGKSPSLNQSQPVPELVASVAPRKERMTHQSNEPTSDKGDGHGHSLYSSGPRTTLLPKPQLYSLPIHADEPSPREAEEMLHVFRTQYLQHLPFMVMPENLTARELRISGPALYLTIMSVTCTKLAQQRTLGVEVRSLLSRSIVVEGKKSLDLLLACLTHMTWSVNQYHQRTISALTGMPMLAMSLIYDLRLNKPVPKEPPFVMLNYTMSGCPMTVNRNPRTLEEKRALLGCFYLLSVSALYFERLDSLRWTPYLDECLQTLTENAPETTDILLALLVRLQLLAQEIPRVSWPLAPTQSFSNTSWAFTLNALIARLQLIKDSVPPSLKSNAILLLNLHHAEFSVREIALTKSNHPTTAIEFQRIEHLSTTLNATKSWFDLFISIPLADYAQFSFPFFAQMAHCIIVVCRLSILEDPAWDLVLVRETLNLSLILDQLANNMSQVEAAAGLDTKDYDGQSIYGECAKRMLNIKEWWEASLTNEKSGAGAMQYGVNGTLGQMSMEGVEDPWFMDMLGAFDYPLDAYGGGFGASADYVANPAAFAPS